MSLIPYLCFVFALGSISCHSIRSNGQKTCDLSDTECPRKLAVKVYKLLVDGVKDLTEPLEPLYIKDFKGNLETFKYKVNGTVTGLRNCRVDLFKFNYPKYEYHLLCPQLVFTHYYDVKGSIAGSDLDGIGLSTATSDNYLIKVKGEYETNNNEKDQKLHIFVKEYRVETDLKGNLIFESKDIIKGDEAIMKTVVAFANSNKNIMVEHIGSQILEEYIAKLMKSFDTFSKATPVDDILEL